MKKILSILLITISTTAFSQHTAAHLDNDNYEEQAKMITEMYSAQLGLRAKQELLMEKKVEQYLIKANEIKKGFEGRAMLDRLVVLQQQETEEMKDILTQIQLKRYVTIKPNIQPLAAVKQ